LNGDEISQLVARPRAHLARMRELFPDAWIEAEGLRRLRGKDLPVWPDWCYLPLHGAYASV
jgi:hypothetical protein